MGISLSRKIFGYIFLKIGPIIKSKKIIDNNLSIFSKNLSLETKNKIISLMWKNYGMTFIEYIFLDFLKKNDNHIKFQGFENLEKITMNHQ